MCKIIKNKGFSLIEMMITMVIASIGMLALGSFYLASIESERVSQERVAAVHFAEQIIEDWQKGNISPTPDCQIAGAAAGQLTIGTTMANCAPNNGIHVPIDILIFERDANAPIANGHLLHSTGAGAPEMGSLLTIPTNGASAHVKIRTVKVSWTVKGRTRDVMLTHITRK